MLAATAAPLAHTVALKTRVGELTEEDMEEFDDAAAHVDIEAEEARKILWGTLKKSHKKKAAAPAAATATPAAGGGATWRDRIASRGAGSSVQGGKVDINNQYMFPDLKTALSGLYVLRLLCSAFICLLCLRCVLEHCRHLIIVHQPPLTLYVCVCVCADPLVLCAVSRRNPWPKHSRARRCGMRWR